MATLKQLGVSQEKARYWMSRGRIPETLPDSVRACTEQALLGRELRIDGRQTES